MSSAQPPQPPPSLGLIVCDVYEQELALATAGAGHIVAKEVLEMGLHDRPEILRTTLQKIITGWESRGDLEAIALVYGLCGCGTTPWLPAGHRLGGPRAHDCRAVLLGNRELFDQRQEACPGCYYYTPGWNRARRVPGPERDAMLRADLASRFDPEDVEFLLESDSSMWESYNTAAYIDHGTPDTEAEAAYTAACAQHLGWRYERVAGDLSWLRDLVWGNWDEHRFQLIEPGHCLVHSPDAAIMRSAPVQ